MSSSSSIGGGLNYSQYSQEHHLARPRLLPSEVSRDDTSYEENPAVELASSKSAQPLIYNSDHQLNPSQSASSFQNNFLYNWWLSIVSVIVSLLAIIAIVVLLIVIDGSSLPKLPLRVTVNTYISFFISIAKAAMLVPVADSISQLKWLWFRQSRALQDIQVFDEASRGPLGALRLLLRTRATQLVAIGAVITILAVVMDPFAQQVISYPSKQIDVGSALVGRAQGYDSDLDIDSLSGLIIGPEFGMKSAVYNGLFTPGGATDLAPGCPSGNCTFPLFESLAFCSRCLDVTNNVVNNDIQKDPEKLQGDYLISYTLPGDAVVEFGVFFSGGDIAMGPSMVSTTALPSNLSKTMFGLQNPLLTFAVLQFPTVGMEISQGSYYSSLPVTHECVLYFCVNTYNVTVENSVPNTNVISSWTDENGTPTVGGLFDGTGYDFSGTVDVVWESPSDGVDGDHTYSIPAGTLANLKSWLNYTLQGSVNTTGSEVDNSNGAVWVNDVMEALNVTSDWPGLIDGLAKSMTTYIRSPGLPGSGNTTGISYKLETFVHCRWPWLALPALLLALSTFFLVTTMIVNARKKVLAWKSNSLALLFHGLEGVELREAGEGIGQMNNIARRTRVKLARSEAGEWKLVNTG